MALAQPWDQMVESADDHEPVIAAGLESFIGLQQKILLDGNITDFCRNVGNDQIIGQIGHAFHRHTANDRRVGDVVLCNIVLRVAYGEQVFIGHHDLGIGVEPRQNNADRTIAAAEIEDCAGCIGLEKAQKNVGTLVNIERRKEGMTDIKREALALMLVRKLLFEIRVHVQWSAISGR